MPQIDFIGSSYKLRSDNVDSQKTINLYPVINEFKIGKEEKRQIHLMNTPGLKKFLQINNAGEYDEIRAVFVDSKDRLFVVCGSAFIQISYDEFYNDYDQVIISNLETNSGPVSIAENGFQLAIVDGDNYYLYIYEDQTFSKISPDGWLGSNTVTYFGTYFVFIERGTQKFYISKPYNGEILDPLDFASKEGYPDNLVTSVTVNQGLWLMGTKSTQIYYNDPNGVREDGTGFPLSVNAGATIKYGCVAPFSVSLADNKLFWLGRDDNGFGTVYMADNYQPIRVSNLAVEYSIQNFNTIEDAIAYSYQQEGHYFYVLNFPSAGTTWVYDMTTGMWHERQFYNKNTGLAERHRAQYHIHWKSKHIVADYQKSILYEMRLDYYDDNGESIQRIRVGPHLYNENLTNVIFNEFQLDIETGTNYSLIDGREAKAMLRYSNDGGRTWSNYLEKNIGKPGEFKHRVIWRRLGVARDRVWEIMISDPVKVVISGAYVNLQECSR